VTVRAEPGSVNYTLIVQWWNFGQGSGSRNGNEEPTAKRVREAEFEGLARGWFSNSMGSGTEFTQRVHRIVRMEGGCCGFDSSKEKLQRKIGFIKSRHR